MLFVSKQIQSHFTGRSFAQHDVLLLGNLATTNMIERKYVATGNEVK